MLWSEKKKRFFAWAWGKGWELILFYLYVCDLAECEKLMELYERLEELDADKAQMRASRILHGLGFTKAMQQKKLKDFSGGWRMRVALARYTFLYKPLGL